MFIGSYSNVFQKLVAESDSPDVLKIANRFFTHYDYAAAFKNASEGVIIMGEGRRYLEYEQRKQFTDK